jgi:hypothetical protein
MATANSSGPKKLYMAAIATIGWFSLGWQLYLVIQNAAANNISTVRAISNFFSFYTILTNILVALACTFPLIAPYSRAGRFFSRHTVQSAICLSIIVVGITFSLLLRHLWDLHGPQKTVNELLHDLMPILYALYWVVFVPKGVLHWRDVSSWFIYPVAYLVYTLLRGIVTGWYPYPFLDANKLGYSKVLTNAFFMTLGFVILGYLLVAINRGLARRTVPVQS